MIRLPVDEVVPEILGFLRTHRNLVLEAPPGAGKTTRVPPALLEFGPVLVLEPRRLAARLAAKRVAQEMGEPVGETVGYQVRFDEAAGPRTRLRFLTEGILTRRLLTDPQLKGIATVVLDEFHERHLDGDLALALLLHLQRTARPDLRLLVMSATLDAGPIAKHLGECPIVRSPGKLFETDLRYLPASTAPLELQVKSALETLVKSGLPGDVLVFLPGAREIRRAMDASAAWLQAKGILALPLFGDLTPEEQDRAVEKGSRPKVIFSTNIAESSVTIEGVRVVIDSGLARIAEDSPFTGLPSLTVKRISQASATQRAGRAARTGPGVVVRLYPAEDLHRRPAQDAPELLRRELSQLLLDLLAMGVDENHLPWLDAPPPAAVAAARALLRRLGAEGARAKAMAQLPLHPRLARLVLEGAARGVRRAACDTAAQLSLGETGDLSGLARQVSRQIDRALQSPTRSPDPDGLDKALLAAFPDRVAKHHRDEEVRLTGGGSARVQRGKVIPPWLVCIDVEERREQGLPLVRDFVPIEPDWLLEMPEIEERQELLWHREGSRIEAVTQLRYGALVIDETRGRPTEPESAAHLLAAKAKEQVHRFIDPDELAELQARLAFAGLGEVDVEARIAELAQGLVSFAELEAVTRNGGLERALVAEAAKLERLAPPRIQLPTGRQARVRYIAGQTPWVASRLQDFFGLRETPRVGQVNLVVHLLAPNQRPVQVTQDLAGFWVRHYPEIRKELSRRYPRHAWPLDPLGTEALQVGKR
ncbi:MAG: ATP-dependent helicase HrpB [Bryobacteraceae bacterium]|nr:ATP-dependent helicase HrpB [Bryobacteraceae bacterium]